MTHHTLARWLTPAGFCVSCPVLADFCALRGFNTNSSCGTHLTRFFTFRDSKPPKGSNWRDTLKACPVVVRYWFDRCYSEKARKAILVRMPVGGGMRKEDIFADLFPRKTRRPMCFACVSHNASSHPQSQNPTSDFVVYLVKPTPWTLQESVSLSLKHSYASLIKPCVDLPGNPGFLCREGRFDSKSRLARVT